jgi:AraC-like DNA-binding protein
MHNPSRWLEPCYSNRLVRPFLAYLTSRGRESAVIDELKALELDERVPIRRMLALVDRWVSVTGQADIGLRAAQLLPRGGAGAGYFAGSSAATLGEALRLVAQFMPIVNEAAEFGLVVHGEAACFELRSRLAINRPASDFQVAAMTRRIGDWSRGMAGLEAWFSHPEPTDTAAYREVLPEVGLRFSAPCDAVVFDARRLDLPLATADAELNTVMVKHATELLARLPSAQSLAHRVRTTVLTLMRAGDLDGSRVAALVGMSRRSLTRHLEQEQTSYSEVLNDVRRELALQLLKRTDLDVQEIASQLGYSLTAAFSRAFRRWEGVSPMQFRRTMGRVGDEASPPPAKEPTSARVLAREDLTG